MKWKVGVVIGVLMFVGVGRVSAQGTTLTVCPLGSNLPECQYFGGDGIQQAVDAAPGGATVLVKNGEYTVSGSGTLKVGYVGHPAKQNLIVMGESTSAVLKNVQTGIFDSSVAVSKVTVKDCSGVGFYVFGVSNFSLSDSVIVGCLMEGIYATDKTVVTIANNTIVRNTVTGVEAYNTMDGLNNPGVTAKNNIIVDTQKNTDGTYGFAIGGSDWAVVGLGNDVINNNLEWNNAGAGTSCAFNEICTYVGKLVADPMFVNPAAGDFHLQPGSPACTGGEGGTYMGAYACKNGDFDGDGYIRLNDITDILSKYTAFSVPLQPGWDKYDLNSDGWLKLSDVTQELAWYTSFAVPVN